MPPPVAAMLGNCLAVALDPDRIDPAPNHDPLARVPDGDRVVVGVEPCQGQRVDAARLDARRVERRRRQREESRELACEPLPDGVGLAPDATHQIITTSSYQNFVDRRKIVGVRDGDEKVAAGEADEVLDVPFLVRPPYQAEVGIKEIMSLQTFKGFCENVAAAVDDLDDGGARIVVADSPWHAAEEGEGPHMPLEEGLGAFTRK